MSTYSHRLIVPSTSMGGRQIPN